jgi:hypothetical protein
MSDDKNASASAPAGTPSDDDKIRQAIRDRLEIEFTYGGVTVVMQPYVYYSTKSGSTKLDGVHVGPSGNTPFQPRWNDVFTNQMKNIVVTPRTFSVDPAHDMRRPNRNPLYTTLHASVW